VTWIEDDDKYFFMLFYSLLADTLSFFLNGIPSWNTASSNIFLPAASGKISAIKKRIFHLVQTNFELHRDYILFAKIPDCK